MTAYNKVNGCHVSESRELLQKLVRNEWGWDPLIISDWFGTYSSGKAIAAGLDLEMPRATRYRGKLVEFAVGSRLISESTIDQRVRRVLKFIQDASSVDVASEEGSRDCPEDRRLIRQLAANGVVLLKNDSSILPLELKRGARIAVVSYPAKYTPINGGGGASLDPYYGISILDAISEVVRDDDVSVLWEMGVFAQKMLPVIDSLSSSPDNVDSGGVIRVRLQHYPNRCGLERGEFHGRHL
ncbi:uncharacterized protein APUU_51571S [Aspergillus puulaauensis]|uniref:Probable beta-glucosidase H n=1 Tax=Aspergillus puulaauensis TaxID=1220207 RepID=A0A7R8ARP8_9EURO|nr:uncharacterized protein APUU_51571S [Aspergillus puulaauensis]BCS26860.1 hypothetical protein APUU_51571S [Aspergillus puulaauensis]